jgi:hypothetical protein
MRWAFTSTTIQSSPLRQRIKPSSGNSGRVSSTSYNGREALRSRIRPTSSALCNPLPRIHRARQSSRRRRGTLWPLLAQCRANPHGLVRISFTPRARSCAGPLAFRVEKFQLCQRCHARLWRGPFGDVARSNALPDERLGIRHRPSRSCHDTWAAHRHRGGSIGRPSGESPGLPRGPCGVLDGNHFHSYQHKAQSRINPPFRQLSGSRREL